MNYKDIESLVITEQIKLIEEVGKKDIKRITGASVSPATLLKEYYGQHEIYSRPDKVITKTVETTDSNGEVKESEEPAGFVDVAKVAVNFQKKIVDIAVAFLFGKPVGLINLNNANEDKFIEFKDKLVNEAGFNNKNSDLARHLFIETIAAKMYYIKNPSDPKNRTLGSRVFCAEYGDTLYINKNNRGNIDVVLREFLTKDVVNGELKDVKRAEMYLENETQYIVYDGDTAIIEGVDKHNYGVIPVVPYVQKYAEWEDVNAMINKYEASFSQLHDTNEYFASPAAKIKGAVSGMPNKSDQGKMFQLEAVTGNDGKTMWSDVEYVTWDQRPESLEMQFEMEKNNIYSISQTPDISFTSLLEKKPGNISGAALEFLMLDPIIKSINKHEIFTPNLKQEIEVAKKICVKLGLDVTDVKVGIVYRSILPKNLTEIIEMLNTATGNKQILSTRTAVSYNPIVEDERKELEEIKKELNDEIVGGATMPE